MKPEYREYTTAPGHVLEISEYRHWTALYRGEWVGVCSCDPTMRFHSPSRLDITGRWEVHLAQEGFDLRGGLGWTP